MAEMRQFVVLEIATGNRTYVRAPYDGNSNNWRGAAVMAGFSAKEWYAHNVKVALLHPADERLLPFDCLPLIVRRGHKAKAAAA